MPRSLTDLVVRDVPLLRRKQNVHDAIEVLLGTDLPALPVAEDDDSFAGIFGEREFMEALFPGYVGTLRSASFVSKRLEDVLEKRASCAMETVEQHMNDEKVAVRGDFSDLQVAEVFLHHRVLIVPVLDDEKIAGLVTRTEFFRGLAERFLAD